MKKLSADVAVIAAGASGLAAACAAAEKGASVIVLEKGSTTGGAANMGMGFFAAGSKIQKKMMIDLSPDKAFNMFMEFTHMRVNARLVRKYVDLSASTVEWIEDMGVEFLGAFKYFKDSEAAWHIVKAPGSNSFAERSASFMFRKMTDRARELGVQFMFQTPAKKLVMENGHVVGVLADGPDGEEIQVECLAAIICTGGFGENEQMIREHLGYVWGKDLFSFQIPGLQGDGLKMAWEAGAGRSPMMMELTYTCPSINNLYMTIQEVMKQPNIMVNLDGQRFMNEQYKNNTPYSGNALSIQRERCGFSIITDEIVDYYRAHGLDYVAFQFGVSTVDRWDEELGNWRSGTGRSTEGVAALRAKMAALGETFWEADSLEELCGKTGINERNLREEIARYNAMCGGVDRQLGKKPEYMLPIRGKKFYAAKFYPSGYGTMGGIKCNDMLEVLTPEGFRLPGLYASGMEANTIYDNTYLFYLPGNTMGFALNSGRMAGYNAVDYIQSDDFVE